MLQLPIGRADGLDIEVGNGTVTITIDNLPEQNRLTPAALARLDAAVAALRGNAEIQVVIVRGAGDEFFSTGLLNPVLRGSMSKEDVLALVFHANAVFDSLEALPQVVIAACNGHVRAGAVELALACDIRVASARARLAMPEAQWGGFPGAGGPVRLPRVVGRGRAMELICTGREIDADEMLRIGLVEHVFPAAEFDVALAAFAGRIAAAGPLATRGAKRIMQVREEPGFRAARELSDALRRALEWSDDVDEAIRAHREERQPRFTGR